MNTLFLYCVDQRGSTNVHTLQFSAVSHVTDVWCVSQERGRLEKRRKRSSWIFRDFPSPPYSQWYITYISVCCWQFHKVFIVVCICNSVLRAGLYITTCQRSWRSSDNIFSTVPVRSLISRPGRFKVRHSDQHTDIHAGHTVSLVYNVESSADSGTPLHWVVEVLASEVGQAGSLLFCKLTCTAHGVM